MCNDGVPSQCSFDCALVFGAFMSDCTDVLSAMLGPDLHIYQEFSALCGSRKNTQHPLYG